MGHGLSLADRARYEVRGTRCEGGGKAWWLRSSYDCLRRIEQLICGYLLTNYLLGLLFVNNGRDLWISLTPPEETRCRSVPRLPGRPARAVERPIRSRTTRRRHRAMLRGVLILAIAAVALAIVSVASASNVHLKGGPRAEPSFTDNGLTLTASGGLAGLGNADGLVTLAAPAGAPP